MQVAILGRAPPPHPVGMLLLNGCGLELPAQLICPSRGLRVRFRLIVTFRVSRLGRLLAVSHTYRPGGVRVISARRVTRLERKVYEEG